MWPGGSNHRPGQVSPGAGGGRDEHGALTVAGGPAQGAMDRVRVGYDDGSPKRWDSVVLLGTAIAPLRSQTAPADSDSGPSVIPRRPNVDPLRTAY